MGSKSLITSAIMPAELASAVFVFLYVFSVVVSVNDSLVSRFYIGDFLTFPLVSFSLMRTSMFFSGL